MPAFISNVLLSVVRSLERPLRLVGRDVFACHDGAIDYPRGFFNFQKEEGARGASYWGLGLHVMVSPVPALRWADLRWNRWQLMNDLARSAHLFGWDIFITHDDPRCGLFNFSFSRDTRGQFTFYGLGLYVLGSPLRLSRR